jgi:Putative lumazine-binding
MAKLILILMLALLSFTTVGFTNNPSSIVRPNSQASNERAAITVVARSYMDAYYTADVKRMDRAIHPDFHKRTLRLRDGQMNITQDTRLSLLEGVRSGTGKHVPLNQRVQKIEVLDVYNNAASVKVVTGGWVDYMLLSKLDGQWRVLDVVLQYTGQ